MPGSVLPLSHSLVHYNIIALSDVIGRKYAIITGGVVYTVGGGLQSGSQFLWLGNLVPRLTFRKESPGMRLGTCISASIIDILMPFLHLQDDICGEIHKWSWCGVRYFMQTLLYEPIVISILSFGMSELYSWLSQCILLSLHLRS